MDYRPQIMRALEISNASSREERAKVYDRARSAFHNKIAQSPGIDASLKASRFNDLIAAIDAVEKEIVEQQRAAAAFSLSAEDMLAEDVRSRNEPASPRMVKVGIFEVEEGSEVHRDLLRQRAEADQDSSVSTQVSAPAKHEVSSGSFEIREKFMHLVGLICAFLTAGAIMLQLGEPMSLDGVPGALLIAAAFLIALLLIVRLVGVQGFSYGDSPWGTGLAMLVLAVVVGLLWEGARDVEKMSYSYVARYIPFGQLTSIPGLSALVGNADAGPPGTIVYSSWETLEPLSVPPGTIVMDDLQ